MKDIVEKIQKENCKPGWRVGKTYFFFFVTFVSKVKTFYVLRMGEERGVEEKEEKEEEERSSRNQHRK